MLRVTGYGRFRTARSVQARKFPVGSVLTVAFELDGQNFTALNGGPLVKLNEAVSFQVSCETQAELDYRELPHRGKYGYGV
jgi:predicted 3-demethylubiquinone-9 3-methyltransferase (glyoxalase superfamily)